MKNKITCYCQNCRAENAAGDANCRQCGTRLLLIVFPQSLKYDTNYVPTFYEDHLLERVSTLELRLAQVTEQLALAYEFISREAKSFQKDHALLESFFETLQKVNPDLSELLSQNTLELFGEKKENLLSKSKRERVLSEIFSAHDAARQSELFAHLVNEGVRLLDCNEEKQAFRNLERAALLSPRNVPLLFFNAEHFFRFDRFDAAREMLERAFEIEPHNAKILLLLGANYGNAGEAERSRKFLSGAATAADEQKNFCVSYVWGMLAAFESNWTESLAAFRAAGENLRLPEIEYLIGCVYFQLGKNKIALRALETAARDAKYADALFMQSVIYSFAGDEESAKDACAAALEAKEAGAQCFEFLKGKRSPKIEIALPFQHFKQSRKNLLTGGSLRLSKFFREQIHKAIE